MPAHGQRTIKASLVPAHYQYREFLLTVSGKGQKRFMLQKDKSSTKQIMGKPKNLNSTWSSVIFRKGEPPPIAAYPSLDLGARSTEINFANGRWRNRNNLGRRMISYVNTRNTLAYKSYEHVLMLTWNLQKQEKKKKINRRKSTKTN